MPLLILLYSRTGNNRILADLIAQKTGAQIAEVRPVGWFPMLRVIWQMATGRRPRVHPLLHDPGAYDRVLVIAPIWDTHVAFPMTATLQSNRAAIGSYDFVTLCGYIREGQPDVARSELAESVGHPPVHQMELHIGDLVPEDQRDDPRKVSAKRITRADMDHFAGQIDDIVGWYDPA
jgi:hypothetical protein